MQHNIKGNNNSESQSVDCQNGSNPDMMEPEFVCIKINPENSEGRNWSDVPASSSACEDKITGEFKMEVSGHGGFWHAGSGEPIPKDFRDVLQDEDDQFEKDDEHLMMHLEVNYHDENVNDKDADIDDCDDDFLPADEVLEPGHGYSSDEELCSSDEELDVRQGMLHAIDPLPVKGSSLPTPRKTPNMRGALAARGGRAAGRGRARAGTDGWTRGNMLVQKYVSDAELPDDVRAQIKQASSRRATNARSRHVDDDDNVFADAEDFTWVPIDDDYEPTKETFTPPHPGPTKHFATAYEAFREIWDDDILGHIVHETNRFAANSITSESFHKTWRDTNVDELLVLFTFWIVLGIIKMPTIKSCYSNNPLFKTHIFRFLMTETRYWNLNRALHFSNGTRDPNDPNNLLYAMGPVLDHLNAKFQASYVMGQDICIDESLTLWKGSLSFKQYIKSKAARFGIKCYQLCESATGYLWSFFVYTGSATNAATERAMPTSSSYVYKLVRPILNLGHRLFMDNLFNSPALARFLKRNKTDCIGTLRANRRGVPQIIEKAPLQEGQFVARKSGDVVVVGLQDRRRVSLISTCHGVSQIQTPARSGRPAKYKLDLVNDYHLGMGRVDRLDQVLEPYLVQHKQCIKWTRQLFKQLLNVSIQNSRVLVEKSTKTRINPLTFRLSLAQSLINHHHRPPLNPPKLQPENLPDRYTARHFIEKIPVTDAMRQACKHSKNIGRKRCALCKKCTTGYHCPDCNVPLCLHICFKQYHTK